MAKYTIGLDYGTNSARAIVVNVANGREIAAAVWTYEHGKEGVILSRDPNLARQHPADYLKGADVTIRRALSEARRAVKNFNPADVIGSIYEQLGIDPDGPLPNPRGLDVKVLPPTVDGKRARGRLKEIM